MSPIHDPRRHAIMGVTAFLLVATSATVQAQQPAGGFVARASVATDRIELNATQVRAILAAHQPAIVAGTSDDNIVTIVLASNGDYVASGTSKGAVAGAIRPAAASATATAVGGAVPATAGGSGGVVVATPAPSGATAILVPRDDDGQPHFIKIAGIGDIDASLLKDMYWAHFAAGEVSVNGLAVRIVTLKGASIK